MTASGVTVFGSGRVRFFIYSRALASIVKRFLKNPTLSDPVWGFLRGFACVTTTHIVYVNYGCSKVYGVLVEADMCDDVLDAIKAAGLQPLCVVVEDKNYRLYAAITFNTPLDKCIGREGAYTALEKSIEARDRGKAPVQYVNCVKEETSESPLPPTWEELVGIVEEIFGKDKIDQILEEREDFETFANCRGTAFVPPEEEEKLGTDVELDNL